MDASKPEADIIFNRANVALARSQRVISGWLPPDEKSQAQSAEELQLEDDEAFTPIPEKLGLGAPLPKKEVNGGPNRSELDSNQSLRKKLMVNGSRKDAAQDKTRSNAQSKEKTASGAAESAPQPDSESEDEGRSSLGKRKRNSTVPASGNSGNGHESGEADNVKGTRGSGGAHRKNTYLDSLLSSRSGKKKGKSKSKGNGNGRSSAEGK